jgi:hypothetical protein
VFYNFQTLNDYHSSLSQKKKKTPNKRKETNAKSMFLSHGHEEGGEEGECTRVPPNLFSKAYKESVLNK